MFDAPGRLRLLRALLRAGGTVLVAAFAATLLPVEWMAAAHEWLRLGEFPRTPLVDYLTRSISALYGFHGILLFIIASDPLKYRVLVRYVVVMNLALGVMLLAIDVHAGLPLFWTFAEGPSLIVLGLLLAFLSADLPNRE